MTEPSTPPPSIQAALSAVMDAVGAVAKKDRNTQQGFLFRGIDAVVSAVSPALREHRVIVVPKLRSIDYTSVPTSDGKKSLSVCRLVMRYRFTGPAGDHIDVVVPGEAFDSGDKATPKAMSVAFRTALLQALALPTDDPDPDGQTYERGHSVTREPAPRQTPPPEPPPVTAEVIHALRARVLQAADTLERGRVRDDALRAVWADAVAAHAERMLVDVPDAWSTAAPEPTVRITDLVQIARAVRVPSQES